MGGAVSLLEENDWERSDGQLDESTSTVDGAPATSSYGVYYLTKRGLNQREYDVTDSDKNLLYTTRAVPDTIACFDLLGKGIDEYLLRVNVDIRRRHWTIYRFNKRTFENQLPDYDATEKVAVEFASLCQLVATPVLFKACRITVSLSRYTAVISNYGPPPIDPCRLSDSLECYGDSDPKEDNPSRGSQDSSKVVEPVDIGQAVSSSNPTEEQPQKSSSSVDKATAKAIEDVEQRLKPAGAPPSARSSFDELPVDLPASPVRTEHCERPATSPNVSQSGSFASTKATSSQLPLDSAKGGMTGKPGHAVRKWVRTTSDSLRETSQRYLDQQRGSMIEKANPQAGVVQLDGPLLLCEEIYNKVVGNHQTSFVSQEKALRLLQQDVAQHVKEHPEDAAVDKVEDNRLLCAEALVSRSDSIDTEDGESDNDRSVEDEKEEKTEDLDDETAHQPLVGYWSWKNTWRSHKMELHLSKRSDLALHVALAVIANQVRSERNAIALAV